MVLAVAKLFNQPLNLGFGFDAFGRAAQRFGTLSRLSDFLWISHSPNSSA